MNLGENPLTGFTNYRVAVTPHSHKIWAIRALGPSASVLGDQFAVISTALAKKYGGTPKRDGPYYTRQFGKRSVQIHDFALSISPDGRFDSLVIIEYVDGNIMALAESERMEFLKQREADAQHDLQDRTKRLEKSGL